MGLGILLYPTASDLYARWQVSREIGGIQRGDREAEGELHISVECGGEIQLVTVGEGPSVLDFHGGTEGGERRCTIHCTKAD